MRTRILSFICCFCLLLATFITVIDFWCFNREFYRLEYSQLNTAEHIGMSEEDLEKTTDVLLGYLKDRDLTLDFQASVKGEMREIFNKREKDHMVDVRELYLNAINVRNIAAGISAFCLVALVVLKDTKQLYRSYLKVLGVFGLFFLFVAAFCIIDFDSFWTGFHHIFFAGNDLWLLDPRTDILIMMVPGKFFFDLCVSIVFTVVVIMLLYLVILKIIDRKVLNRC